MSTKRKQPGTGVDPRALLRTLLEKRAVTDTLSRAASSKDTTPAELERILAALADAGVPVAAYRAQMASPVLSHCVRCHEQYDPLKNSARACCFAHEEPEWSEDEDTGAGYRKYPCCNEDVDESLYFDGRLDGPLPLCISESHTTNPEDVDRSIELDGYYPCDEDCPKNPEPDTGKKAKKAKKA